MGYGDLNGGSGLGKLDGGSHAPGPARRLAMFGRRDPGFGGCGVQERRISAATSMSVRVSLVRWSADGESFWGERRMLMADSQMAAVRGCAALVRKSG
jgi:hypothetical protein